MSKMSLGIDNSIMGAEMERGGELRRYIFAAELNGTIGTKAETEKEASNTYTWNPENAASTFNKIPVVNDEYETVRHTLVLRRVVLGPSSKEGESNWIGVEVIDPEGSNTKFPVACLTKGNEQQAMIDLVFPDARDVRVKFTLEEGTGPVHLIGYHLIERLQYENQEDEYEEEDYDEEEVDENIDATEGTTEKVGKVTALRAKRRINGAENGNGDVVNPKKMKTDDGEEGMEDAPTNGDAKK